MTENDGPVTVDDAGVLRALVRERLPANALAWTGLLGSSDGVRRWLGYVREPDESLREGILRGFTAAVLLGGSNVPVPGAVLDAVTTLSLVADGGVRAYALAARVALGDERAEPSLVAALGGPANACTLWGVLALASMPTRAAGDSLVRVAARLRWTRDAFGESEGPSAAAPRVITVLGEVLPTDASGVIASRASGALGPAERDAWDACMRRVQKRGLQQGGRRCGSA